MLLSNGCILHGLIWSMVSTSPRSCWDLRSHQAHTFERHLFIFKMQMWPTSKAISCREHTMWMCWSAAPEGGGCLRTPLMSGSGSLPLTHPSPASHTQTCLSKKKGGGGREAFLTPKPCLPILQLYWQGFNGAHLHKVCRRLRGYVCQWRAGLKRARGNNARSPPPALPSLQPLLAPSLVLQWEAPRIGGLGLGRLMCPLWSSSRHTE